MMTARVLAVGHPDDRRETAARFSLEEDALRDHAVLLMGLAVDDAHRLMRLVAGTGVRAVAVPCAKAHGGRADVLLAGSREALGAAAGAVDPPVASAIVTALRRSETPPPDLVARGRRLPMAGRPLIVGILNATPDSFYDRGRYFGLERATARLEEMVSEGADIVEVGGETARPSAPVLSDDEEIRRVVPVIEAASRLPLPVGIDTYKPAVARAAIDAGASIVNDISGLADERLASVAAAAGTALIITHMRLRPKLADPHAQYVRVMDEVYAFLAGQAARAEARGVPRQALVVDPGLSFGKQPAHDVTVVRRLREFRGLGLPIYLAASRKNFIRDLLGLPFEELLEGTMAVVALGVLAGANLIRTHDVRAMRRLADMLWTVLGPTPPVRGDAPPGTPP